MAGYDLSSVVPFRLMQGRLGVGDKRPFEPDTNSVDGVDLQGVRLRNAGGNKQQERMIKDKCRSLERAVWNSYQGAEIIKVGAETKKPARALINPDRLKQDYDDKILSIDFSYNIKVGDVFDWVGTNTKWLVYLQDLTELAYFRGEIRRCRYEIVWQDETGALHRTFAAVKGPQETSIISVQKNGDIMDTPNYSLNILLPLGEETKEYFKRYAKFYLQGDTTCWRVEAVDNISTPGIIELVAKENYSNTMEDDVPAGIVGGLIEEPTVEGSMEIVGETFIKVKKSYFYEFDGTLAETWKVDKKYPVQLTLDPTDPRKVRVRWTSSYCGQFDLIYGDYKKTIVVESLF